MIYLDYQATTPLAPEARDAMLLWLDGPGGSGFGNPHSPHRMGRQAAAAVELARDRVAALLPPGGRVIFTSGATEALNLAIRGSGSKGSVSVSAIEHAAVLDTAENAGRAHVLNVASNGQCNTAQDVPNDVRLIAVMQVNNEIGTVQPTIDWHRKAKAANALYLCDAVQSYGRMEVTGADMIAISAHKIHGPKGVGALWVRDGVSLEQVQTGGGQEQGLRSGTLSPALCAGFGAAAAEAGERMARDAEHVEKLWDRAAALFADWELNGSAEARWHGNMSFAARRARCEPSDERLPRRDVLRRQRLRQRLGPAEPRAAGDRPVRRPGEIDHPARLGALFDGRGDRDRRRKDQPRCREAAVVKVRFVTPAGATVEAEVAPGATLLAVGQAAGIPLEGTCEGQMACSTCHVIVASDWFAAPARSERGGGGHAGSRLWRRTDQPPRLPDRAGRDACGTGSTGAGRSARHAGLKPRCSAEAAIAACGHEGQLGGDRPRPSQQWRGRGRQGA